MSLEQPHSYEERRDSVRVKRIVTVHHRLVKHNGKSVKSPWQVSLTEDMSLSGLLFASAIPYAQDDLVEVEVVMSGILDIFKGYGKVIRLVKKKGYYHVGLKYSDLKSGASPKKKK